MSGRDFSQKCRHIDENTPLHMKIGVLIAIITFAFGVGGWVFRSDSMSAANAGAIATVATKLEALDGKVTTMADNIVALRYEVGSLHPIAVQTANK